MKNALLALALLALGISQASAQANIAAARALGVGAVVTVRGIVTNGPELGNIRYLQDATAGVGAYFQSSQLSNQPISVGDSVEITGTLKNYNSLLEIDPITTATVISTGNPVPAPLVLTLTAGYAEQYEGMLVRFNGVSFTGTGVFAGNTNYNITNGSTTKALRSITGTNLVGAPIPSGSVNVQGILSQFSSSNPATGYQLLPRYITDVNVGGTGPGFASSLTQKNITTTSFDVKFNTTNPGNAIIYYGLTASFGSIASSATVGTGHTVSLNGLTPATIYYVKAASVSPSGDTSWSGTTRMATASLSSGKMTIYFNSPLDTTVKVNKAAKRLNTLVDDTLIAYINRAKQSIDIAIYNWNNQNISDITSAVNNAYSRGVSVRVVYDGNNANVGLNTLNVGIKKVASAPSSQTIGIMHNKFMIIDAESANPNDPIVWTGSTNWTDDQINIDPNNVVIIQDQTLARAYKVEFEEMWGSSTLTPGASKFSINKTDNTPHFFNIGGKPVELYFSPSDNAEFAIISAINSANKDIEIAIFELTRTTYSQAIRDRYLANSNMLVAGVEDDTTTNGGSLNAPYYNLVNLIQNRFYLYQGSGQPGLLHHKYVIVDQNDISSDPIVVTGSHNWSSAANTKNDENTLIIHSAEATDQFFQEWVALYKAAGGTVFVSGVQAPSVLAVQSPLYPNPAQAEVSFSIYMHNAAAVNFSIVDMAGRVVYTKSMNATQGTNQVSLNTENLPAGYYQVVTSVNGQTQGNPLSIVR